MENAGALDRRVFERIPLKLSMRFQDLNSHGWGLVETQDVSAKGLGFISEKEVTPYTQLEVWLPLVNKGESFYTRGQVMWSKMLGSNRYRIGVELDKADFMGISQVLRAANISPRELAVAESGQEASLS